MNKYDLFSFTARIYYDYIKTLENRVSTFMIQHQCEKTDLYKANLMYMALDSDTGSHSIVLKYHTPSHCRSMDFCYICLAIWRMGIFFRI